MVIKQLKNRKTGKTDLGSLKNRALTEKEEKLKVVY